MQLPDGLTRQLGPFPVWGWIVIAVGGIGGGLLIRRIQDSGSTASGSGSGASGGGGATSGYLASTTGPGYAGGGAVNDTYQAPEAETPITTNTQWRQAALD